jgi:hypothetical protein
VDRLNERIGLIATVDDSHLLVEVLVLIFNASLPRVDFAAHPSQQSGKSGSRTGPFMVFRSS